MSLVRAIAVMAVLIIVALMVSRMFGASTAHDQEVAAGTAPPPVSPSRDNIAATIPATQPERPAPGIDAPATAECDLGQLETLQLFNRDNLRRRENSRLEPEAIAAYRGMRPAELRALVEQEDSLAMMVYGLYYLFAAMGRNPALAVDYLYYGMPIREITPNPNGVPDNYRSYAIEARRVFEEAAMRGRHAAFTFIGLTYDAEGKNAVDLLWLSEEAYETLSDKQKFNVEPRIAYSQLAFRIDPNLLPVGSPNRKMFEDNFASLGEHGRFMETLEAGFRRKMTARGLSFPQLPEAVYPDVDQASIEACEEAGYSQWD